MDDKDSLSAASSLLNSDKEVNGTAGNKSAVVGRDIDTDGRVRGLDLAEVVEEACRVRGG